MPRWVEGWLEPPTLRGVIRWWGHQFLLTLFYNKKTLLTYYYCFLSFPLRFNYFHFFHIWIIHWKGDATDFYSTLYWPFVIQNIYIIKVFLCSLRLRPSFFKIVWSNEEEARIVAYKVCFFIQSLYEQNYDVGVDILVVSHLVIECGNK